MINNCIAMIFLPYRSFWRHIHRANGED